MTKDTKGEDWEREFIDMFCEIPKDGYLYWKGWHSENLNLVPVPNEIINYINELLNDLLAHHDAKKVKAIEGLRMSKYFSVEEHERGRAISKKYGWNAAIDAILKLSQTNKEEI